MKIGTLKLPSATSDCMMIASEYDTTYGQPSSWGELEMDASCVNTPPEYEKRCEDTTDDSIETDPYPCANITKDGDIVHALPDFPDKSVVEKLQNLLSKHRNCFAKNMSELGESKSFELQLTLKDEEPFNAPFYRLNTLQQEAMDHQIQEFLDLGIIEESISGSYSSPAFMIPKKRKGAWRMVIDFRTLNRKLVSDDFPVPNMQEIFDQLGGAKYFYWLGPSFQCIGMGPLAPTVATMALTNVLSPRKL